MSLPWSGTLATILILLAGCALGRSLPAPDSKASPSPVVPAAAREPSAELLGIDSRKLARLIRQTTVHPRPAIDPEEAYGVWVLDNGNTRTWLRIERPKIHIVAVDKEKELTWIMDGDYSVARDGTVFGVMTALDEATGPKERIRALWNGEEELLRRQKAPKENRPLPFCCAIRPAADGLVVEEVRGACFHDGRDAFFKGRFHKVRLGRPSYARPDAPLGAWERELPGIKARTVLRIVPGRFDLMILDQVTRQRLRLDGEHEVAAGGLLYGLVTSLECSGGAAPLGGPIVPQPFCVRFAWNGNALEIQDVHFCCFEDKTNQILKGSYFPEGRH